MGKKIAIIIERIDTALGGAERSVIELSAALSALGAEVTVLAAKGQRQAENLHILCGKNPGKRTCHRTFAKALRKHLSENYYDVIHSVLPFDFADVYQPRGGTYAESILRNAASYQNTLIESYKKLTAFANLRRTALMRAERRLCRQPSGPTIVAISHYVADQLKQHYAVAQERIVVIPNGIRINTIPNATTSDRLRRPIVARLGIKETEKPVFFLFVANNFRLKGLAALIRAMHLAARRQTADAAFIIVAGSGETRKYYRLAEKLNVHEKIVFLGPVEHVQDLLSVSDVGVLPTFYDPCSRFILEALAAGKPVITTRFNGAADLFVNDRHGKVIDSPENISQLAEAIGYFTNRNNIQKASEAIAADNLTEKISVDRVAKELLSVYECISRKKSARQCTQLSQ
jgi:UDP-glucose:(heptosyl)LPS alpha-1,3-glucosyltransferase